MPRASVELPEPRIVIQFTIDELSWLYADTSREYPVIIEGITNPNTNITKNLRLVVSAEDPA